LQRLTRCSQPYVSRVHSSNECVQAYERRVRACPSRLLGYTSIETLYLGVSRANQHDLRTSLQRLWPVMLSLLPAFPDSSATCRGSCWRVLPWKTCQSRSMAGKSRCPSFTLLKELHYVSISQIRTRDRCVGPGGHAGARAGVGRFSDAACSR